MLNVGTGKTTLVQYIIDALRVPEDKVVYIAYTGKASLVLKKKGCQNAITAHRLLYHAEEQPDGSYIFIPRRTLEKKYKLIVLDEASMLPDEMFQLLLSHGVHVLALGDHGQLPPIDSTTNILDHPHAVLEEIVRQAMDSPIIRLSMDIRAGKFLHYDISNKECRIMSQDDVTDGLLIGADQILCGRNATRWRLNEQVRRIQWGDNYTLEPKNGDKIICLKNQWKVTSNIADPLTNGMIGRLSNIQLTESRFYKPHMIADFDSENSGFYEHLHMDYKMFTEHQSTVNKENWKHYIEAVKPYPFDYAQAVTVHRYQGSEAEKVIVYDEWLGDREYHKKWLYTASTRASKMLVIVK